MFQKVICGCPECEYHNSAAGNEYRKYVDYKYFKPKTIIKKKIGSWNCSSCSEMNFASLTTCRKCGDRMTFKGREIKTSVCIVCMNEERNTLIRKCGHFGYCEHCAKKLKSSQSVVLNITPPMILLECSRHK